MWKVSTEVHLCESAGDGTMIKMEKKSSSAWDETFN